MRLNYSYKLVIPVLIAVFTVVMVALVYINKLDALLFEAEREAISEARRGMSITRGAMEALLQAGQDEGVASIIALHADSPYLVAMFVFQPDGRIIFSSRAADQHRFWREQGYPLSDAIVRRVQLSRAMELVKSADGESLYGYAPVCGTPGSSALPSLRCNTLFYQISLQSYREVVGQGVWRQFLQEAAGIVLISLALWVVFHFMLTRPTDHLISTLRDFSRGQRGVRTNMSSGGELSRIGQGIDKMLDKIVVDEATLREREEYLRALFESVSEAILTIDNTGVLLKVNHAAEVMFGYSAAQMLGKNIELLFPCDDVLGVLRQLLDGAGGGGRQCECRGQKKGGQRIFVEGYFNVIDVTSSPLVVGVVRDVSARRRAEEKLVLAKQVFDHSGEAIMITDERTRIIDVNPALLSVSGYSRAELIGELPSLMKSGRHNAKFYQAMWQEIKARGCWVGEMWDRRKSGEIYPKKLTINAIKNAAGEVTHYVGIFSDISHQKDVEEKLQLLAYYDPLTQLANRSLFKDRLLREIEVSKRQRTRFALLFIDLDRFKAVNDTLGHNVGDKLLQAVASRIKQCVRESDTVARLGGDEFTVILANVHAEPGVSMVAENIIDSLQDPFDIDGQLVQVGASIGVAIYPDNGADYSTLLKSADAAMYQAKNEGRGRCRFFAGALESGESH